jgi:hypothetical protein
VEEEVVLHSQVVHLVQQVLVVLEGVVQVQQHQVMELLVILILVGVVEEVILQHLVLVEKELLY